MPVQMQEAMWILHSNSHGMPMQLYAGSCQVPPRMLKGYEQQQQQNYWSKQNVYMPNQVQHATRMSARQRDVSQVCTVMDLGF